MDYLTTQEPEEMSLSSSKKCQKRQGAELLCNRDVRLDVVPCQVIQLVLRILT